MWKFSLKQLILDKTRSMLIVFAIGSAISVVLILSGFKNGLYQQSIDIVMNRGADLIVLQSGVANFFVTRSSIPQLTRAKIEDIPGVKIAHPATGIWIIYTTETKQMPLFLMVNDIEGFGGPRRIIAGKAPEKSRDIVVDLGLAKNFKLSVGDPIVISDFEFKISGISQGESSMFSPIGFVNFDSLIDLFLESEIASDISTFPLLSFMWIEIAEGYDTQKVRQTIETVVPEVDVMSPEELALNDKQVGEELFGPIMSVLTGLAFIICLLVIGLIIYAEVNSRKRDFAVLKALGFRVSKILNSIVIQTLAYVLAAFPFGLAIAWVSARGIETSMPVYSVKIFEFKELLIIMSGVVMIALVGSLLPLRLIRKADPQSAFQAD